ncbi:hypothetical protein L1887_13996 [Cichorium endivia]|nr:hypothetical protein L1887_13996 [Cichorium endivia]
MKSNNEACPALPPPSPATTAPIAAGNSTEGAVFVDPRCCRCAVVVHASVLEKNVNTRREYGLPDFS